jgi:hypothetical protein
MKRRSRRRRRDYYYYGTVSEIKDGIKTDVRE